MPPPRAVPAPHPFGAAAAAGGVATSILPAPSPAARRAALAAFAARVLGVASVAIRHAEGEPPRLLDPPRPLVLSSASRDGLAAFAAAPGPVGIDVERADEAGAIPFGVLHPSERAALVALADPARRADLFAAVWACKEAYLKALGTGFARGPETVAVTFEGEGATIRDGVRRARAGLRRFSHAGAVFVVALVVLDGQPATGSSSTP